MPRSPRNRLQNDERRAQLLDLGVSLFSQRPYDEVSIDEIAELASISRGLLYHYFGGKRSFYMACIKIAAGQLLNALSPDISLPGPQRVVQALNTYLDWVSARSSAYLALMRGGIDGKVAIILEETRATLVERMLDGMALASSGPHPAFTLAARSWLGSVEAAAASWLDAPTSIPRDALVSLLVTNLITNLAVAQRLAPDAGFEMEPSARALLRSLASD